MVIIEEDEECSVVFVDELSFKASDVIEIVNDQTDDENWMVRSAFLTEYFGVKWRKATPFINHPIKHDFILLKN